MGHITIWNICEKQSIRSERTTRNILCQYSMLLPLNYHGWIDVVREILSSELIQAESTLWWHLPQIVLLTIQQFRLSKWYFWVSWEVLNKFGNLAIANIVRHGSLKALFVLGQRNIDMCLYVTLARYITIWNICEKKQSMRSEPQEIVSVSLLLRLNYRGWIDVVREILLSDLTRAESTLWWHVPLIVLVTIRQFC